MHTQTASASEHPARPAPRLQTATGLGLYLLTLAGEVVLGAGVRSLLAYVGAAALGAIVPLGLGAAQLAFLAAFAPLAWSLLGLALPGSGIVWPRRIGARRPSAEEAAVVADAHGLLRGAEPDLPAPRSAKERTWPVTSPTTICRSTSRSAASPSTSPSTRPSPTGSSACSRG